MIYIHFILPSCSVPIAQLEELVVGLTAKYILNAARRFRCNSFVYFR